MLELHDRPELVADVEDHAVLEVVGGSQETSLSYDGWLAGLRRRQRERSSPRGTTRGIGFILAGQKPCSRTSDPKGVNQQGHEGRACMS